MAEMDNPGMMREMERPQTAESPLRKESHSHRDMTFRPYSLSFDAPIVVRIPTSQCSGRSEDELKEWVWKHHQDSIMAALRLDSRAASDVDEEEEEEEEKKEASIPSKKRRSILDGKGAEKKSREHLLDTIAHVQRQFFQSESPKIVFGYLLEGLLDLMESEYGFIGEIKYEGDGTMYLQTHAITNIAWNQATRQFYDDNIHAGTCSFSLYW